MALTSSSGVTSSMAFLSSAVLPATSGLRSTPIRFRMASVWRSSSSVCVKMSPLTFTSTRSRICPRTGTASAARRTRVDRIFITFTLSCWN